MTLSSMQRQGSFYSMDHGDYQALGACFQGTAVPRDLRTVRNGPVDPAGGRQRQSKSRLSKLSSSAKGKHGSLRHRTAEALLFVRLEALIALLGNFEYGRGTSWSPCRGVGPHTVWEIPITTVAQQPYHDNTSSRNNNIRLRYLSPEVPFLISCFTFPRSTRCQHVNNIRRPALGSYVVVPKPSPS